MNLRPPPAFQCYASDLLASECFRLATMAERGLLISMLMQAWVSDSLPENPRDLARLLGVDQESVCDNLCARVLSFFVADGNGRLICPELSDQKANLEARRAERSASGRRGANALHHKGRKAGGLAMAQPSPGAMTAPEKKGKEKSKKERKSLGECEKRKSDIDEWKAQYEKTELVAW